MAYKGQGHGFVSQAEYYGSSGSAPGKELNAARGTTVLAGGMPYDPPVEVDTRICAATRKDGEACQAFAGANGFCVGHTPRR